MVSPRGWLKLGGHQWPLVFFFFFLISVTSSPCTLLMDLEKASNFPGNKKPVLVPFTKCKVGLPLNAISDLFSLLSLRTDKLVNALVKVLNSYCSNWESFREIEFITIDLLVFYGVINFYHSNNRQWAVQKEQLGTNLLPVAPVPSAVRVMHRAFSKFLLTVMKISKNRKEPIKTKLMYVCIPSPTFMVRNMILEPHSVPLNPNPQDLGLEICT